MVGDRVYRTRADYDLVRSGIAECRTLRGRVESARTDLKRQVLEVGRAIDGEAKRITHAILEVEEPLRCLKDEHDAKVEAERAAKVEAANKARQEELRRQIEEQQAAERAAAEAARKELEAREAQLRAEREELERQKGRSRGRGRTNKGGGRGRGGQSSSRAREETASRARRAGAAAQGTTSRGCQGRGHRGRQSRGAEAAGRGEAERRTSDGNNVLPMSNAKNSLDSRQSRIEQERVARLEQERQEAEARVAERRAAMPEWQAICFYLDEFENIQEPDPKGQRASVVYGTPTEALQSFRMEAYENVKNKEDTDHDRQPNIRGSTGRIPSINHGSRCWQSRRNSTTGVLYPERFPKLESRPKCRSVLPSSNFCSAVNTTTCYCRRRSRETRSGLRGVSIVIAREKRC